MLKLAREQKNEQEKFQQSNRSQERGKMKKAQETEQNKMVKIFPNILATSNGTVELFY